MRKLFLKYFFSILAITVLSLFVQNGILFVSYSQSQNEWKDFIYYDFIDEVQKNLEQGSFPNFSLDSGKLFGSAFSDSRISGFLVRDQKGKISFTVNQTADGRVMTTPVTSAFSDNGHKVSSNVAHTTLNIVYNGRFFEIERLIQPAEKTTYDIPENVKANDVIGSVTIMFESQTLSTIDILSYSPRTYKYSRDIINACLQSIIIAVPICLIIALVFSYIISAKNTKYIDGIRKALNELAHGKINVKLKENKNSELNEITTAVGELDKTLQANRKSRQAWLTSISHDLSTPATSIKMIVDGMNDGVFKANKTTLKDLQVESDTLCKRIQRVIDFSSLQAETKASVSTVNCHDLYKVLPSDITPYNVVYNTEELQCDATLMYRALVELLSNAFAADSDASSIILTFNPNEITVSNKGSLPPGFNNEAYFEPWTKGDKSRSTSGNGLGLAIVGTIAKLHNGQASLSENNGIITASVKWSL